MFAQSLVEQLIDKCPVARLGQTDVRGHAQVLPFVFARAGGALWSPIDGKPKKNSELDRLTWVAEHPDVCVLIDHYSEDWSSLWWLKLFCRAVVYRTHHADWDEASRALAIKYPQYAETPMFFGNPTMIRFEIDSWKSWAAGGESRVQQWLSDNSELAGSNSDHGAPIA
ncbi:MAG: PPOX class probable F420-dependent enzyme [Gammaproteobacteria bacterium]|jgi:PPOX class probable F420-dependent enzyme